MDGMNWGSSYLDDTYRYQYTGYGVRIYVVDSGIHNHPDVAGRIASGIDFVHDGHGTDDLNGHGTITASLAAGFKAGPAKDAELVPVRVFANQDPNTSQLVTAIDWILGDLYARSPSMSVVVNLPFSPGISSSLDKAVQSLVSRGIVVTVPAGNFGGSACNFSPSHLSQVITSGAVQRNAAGPKYAIWPSSGAGACVTLMSPGVGVGSAHGIYNDYNCNPGWDGTSWATALTAGIAALYLEAYPNSSPSEIKQLMLDNADHSLIAGDLRGAPSIFVQTPPGWVVADCNSQCLYHCDWQ
jgi:subtilisin family serine protease